MEGIGSVHTILDSSTRLGEDNFSDWSLQWSTSHVPGMDTATGAGSSRRRRTGRRRLRLGAFTMASALSMHVRVAAAGLCNGLFVFILLMIVATIGVANPVRHFEVYLGQWSISGPGRAFRIIPVCDGTGIAMCIHALLRLTLCIAMAAISAIYVFSSVSDDRLPSSLCRDFDLNPYEPSIIYIAPDKKFSNLEGLEAPSEEEEATYKLLSAGIKESSRVAALLKKKNWKFSSNRTVFKRVTYVCKETYPDNFPVIYKTSAYNYFFVEVMRYRADGTESSFNTPLFTCMVLLYAFIWMLLFIEKLSNGRIIFNNMYSWFIGIPWLWCLLTLYIGFYAFFTRPIATRNTFRLEGNGDLVATVADACLIALYTHASGIGNELILGKGLNHYAAGHIDPYLNSEVMWHSALLWIITSLNSVGATFCGLTDSMQIRGINEAAETSLWTFPLYAKCTLHSRKYSHLLSTLLFSGLCFSYTLVAFVCLKTILHTIFEYRVKLVFVEQMVVGILLSSCAIVSALFATRLGLGIIEALDVITAAVVAPLIVFLEMLGMMFLYRSHDFVSDMNIATEENQCATRIGIQWLATPIICPMLIIYQLVSLVSSEIPGRYIWIGFIPVFVVILAIPARALSNACSMLRRCQTQTK